MDGLISITVLIDDSTPRPDIVSEHGLSMFVQCPGRAVLFDTGKSGAFIRNAETLGIDLRAAGTLVLSHGHYDHTGGLHEFFTRNPGIEICCNPGAVIPRYSVSADHTVKAIGMSPDNAGILTDSNARVRWAVSPVRISGSIGVTGPVPRTTDFEDTGGGFFLDPEATRADPVTDDCAMWIETSQGLVILTGCCHSGLVNTVRYVREISGTHRVNAIIGGFHLLSASGDRLDRTVEFLRGCDISHLVPCHCTGDGAYERLMEMPGIKVKRGASGDRLEFPA